MSALSFSPTSLLRAAFTALALAIFGGAISPYHWVVSKPFQPCSPTVAPSGNCGRRAVVPVAMQRRRQGAPDPQSLLSLTDFMNPNLFSRRRWLARIAAAGDAFTPR